MASGLFPIILRIEQLPVLIVGGGRVGARRARALLEAGAQQVTVVSPAFDPEMPEGVTRLHDRFRAAHLHGQRLVFAATDSEEVNRHVAECAETAGVLCGRADDASEGEFHVPAVATSGEVVAAVVAGTPAITLRLRDEIREVVAAWAPLAEAAGRLRRVVGTEAGAESRRRVLQDLARDEALDVLRAGGMTAVARWLTERHPSLGGRIERALRPDAATTRIPPSQNEPVGR